MPVVDAISAEYADEVVFLAVAWKSEPDRAAAVAADLMPSGRILWGLDNEEKVFEAFGVPYQPVTILITPDDRVFGGWAGLNTEEGIRDALDQLLAISG